jgi:hypothetical protein
MENIQLTSTLKSHFLNLYSIALSDTQIDTVELELLFNFGIKRGIEKEEIEKIILNPHLVKFSIPDDVLEKIEYLYEFAVMIWADGKVDDYERETLFKFCEKFGFESENIPSIVEFLLEEANKETSLEEIYEMVKQNLN